MLQISSEPSQEAVAVSVFYNNYVDVYENKVCSTHNDSSRDSQTFGKCFSIEVKLSCQNNFMYPLYAMIDCGSTISLLRKEVYNYINSNCHVPLLKSDIKLRSITGNELISYGKINVGLLLGDNLFNICLVVVDDRCTFNSQMLIGTDILSSLPISLNFNSNSLTLKGNNVSINLPLRVNVHLNANNCSQNALNNHLCNSQNAQNNSFSSFLDHNYLSSDHVNETQLSNNHVENQSLVGSVFIDDDFNYNMYSTESIVLEPYSVYVLPVKVESQAKTYPPNDLFIVSEKNSISNVLFANTLSKTKDNFALVQCINMSNNSFTLDKNVRLCHAYPLNYKLEVSSDINTVSSSKGLSDLQLKDAYREILLSKSAKESDLIVLQDETQLENILDFLVKHKNAIALSNDSVGLCTLNKFKLELTPDAPRVIYTPNYRLPHKYQEDINNWVDDCLSKNYIESSTSPHSSPMLVIPKKDGKARIVLDFRYLNRFTLPDRFPLGNIHEIFSKLGEAKVFSTLDLLSGFYHIEVEEDSRKYMAFSTHKGHYQPVRMQMGLKNAPSCFSRTMELALSKVLGVGALLYLDDIIVYSKNIESHYSNLSSVFNCLIKSNLKVKLEKANFFKRSLVFLGFQVGEFGISADPTKLDVLKSFAQPTDINSARSFIGFVSYFRHLVPNFSVIASPITSLFKKNVDFIWGLEQQNAFNILKEKLLVEPLLKFPDYSKDFIISTDASGVGLGCCLSQLDDKGKEKPLSFASRMLSKAERNYSTIEREALAVTWALSKFRTTVFGYPLIIKVDQLPLVQIFKSKDLNNKLARWAMKVNSFNPQFIYIPGKSNVIPDYLSRNPPMDINSV